MRQSARFGPSVRPPGAPRPSPPAPAPRPSPRPPSRRAGPGTSGAGASRSVNTYRRGSDLGRRDPKSPVGEDRAGAARDLTDNPRPEPLQGFQDLVHGPSRGDHDEPRPHVERLVHFAVLDPGEPLDREKLRLWGQRVRDPELDVRLQAHEVPQPTTRDVREGGDIPPHEGLEDGPDIDPRGLEKGSAPWAIPLGDRVQRGHGVLPEHAADQREAVAVEPAARDPDDAIPRAGRLPVDDLLLIDEPEARSNEIEPVDDLGHHGELATDDRHVRLPRRRVEAESHLAGEFGIVRVDRQVIDERHGLRPRADHVVHVRRDAIDPDGVPAPHLARDEDLRHHGIRAHPEGGLAEIHEAREVARGAPRGTDAPAAEPELRDEGPHLRSFRVDVHARLRVRADHRRVVASDGIRFCPCADDERPAVSRSTQGDPVGTPHGGGGGASTGSGWPGRGLDRRFPKFLAKRAWSIRPLTNASATFCAVGWSPRPRRRRRFFAYRSFGIFPFSNARRKFRIWFSIVIDTEIPSLDDRDAPGDDKGSATKGCPKLLKYPGGELRSRAGEEAGSAFDIPQEPPHSFFQFHEEGPATCVTRHLGASSLRLRPQPPLDGLGDRGLILLARRSPGSRGSSP